MLGQHAGAPACGGGEHSLCNLDRKCTPPPQPMPPPLSLGVMGEEDVSCHSVRDRESLNPGFIISGVAGNWTSAPKGNSQPALWHHPASVASKQTCHLPVLSAHGVGFLWRGFLHLGWEGFLEKHLLCATGSLSPHPFLFPFQGSRNC